MRIALLTIVLSLSASAAATECRNILSGSERLACYDDRESLIASNNSYDVFRLWKAKLASRECAALELSPDGFAQNLIASGLRESDVALAPRSPADISKMDEQLESLRASNAAWCASVMDELGIGEGNYGFALLRRKGSCDH